MERPVAHLPAWLRPEPSGVMVRLGRDNDGGYVVPEAIIRQADGLLSLGLNDDWSFDRDFERRHPRAPIVGYDPTVRHAKFIFKALGRTLILPIAALLKPSHALKRTRHAWYAAIDYGRFFGRRATHHRLWMSGQTGPASTTLPAALADPVFAACTRLVIKMDIEGAEYPVFASLPEGALSKTGLLLVEFHNLGAHLEAVASLARRLAPDFAVVHVHANNYGPVVDGRPEVIEVAWARRALIPSSVSSGSVDLPLVGLDQSNHPRRIDIALRFDT